ncbi:NAD(P)-dependent oxidoreductase [Cyanobium sp. FACHB-13342]|uniref:NAD-dependent epimerase/dehydratase family protein n=1 Tax=Cyanobium sp. FACHB-13342 TaxID=2692793 RepID=UPI0016808A1C|nr:NAD(P)-dependent oxidoreductase [Cyanobium sp. FACHB-13342]MBD2423789.1 NAD(P)-dependent oxidoreductase [Cyanobium sp. FACHB-13342]
MKIALTGGTGFIGSHYLNRALADGHLVRAFRRSPESKCRIPITQQPDWFDRQINQVAREDLNGCDVLVHLATHTGNVPYDSLANCFYWNVSAAISLFEEARLAGIKRYIVAGSCFEYGASGARYDQIPTDAPLEPTNSYSASKSAASIALMQWAKEYKLNLEIIRVFHVYGDGELSTRLWPSLKSAALSGRDFAMTKGEQVRDFIDVRQCASIFLRRTTLQLQDDRHQLIFNMSSGRPQSILDFSRTWWNQWNAKGELLVGQLPYRDGEVMQYIPGPNILSPVDD